MSLVSETTGEIAVNKTFLNAREQVVAEVGISEGRYGLQVAFLQDRDRYSPALRFLRNKNVNGYAQLSRVDYESSEIRRFAQHNEYASFFGHFGMSLDDVVSNGQRVRVSKMPMNAAFLNAALDDISGHNGFRFYDAGISNEDGEVYLQNVNVGLAPLGEYRFIGSMFFHDLFQHGTGYMGLSNRKVETFRRKAGEALEKGITRDIFGKLERDTPASKVANLVDDKTFSLTSDVRFGTSLFSRARVRRALPQLRKI